jgi:hypothetical protein
VKKSGKTTRWPAPGFDESDQPHFLFIVTPPYSGSTALSELINTSHKTMILQERGEGQWLIPGLCEQDRWGAGKEVNYHSVKSVWLNKYQRVNRLTQNIEVVIEKSPPNMMRIEKLSSQFHDFSFIANNRDPYANSASNFYREFDAGNISSERRGKLFAQLARNWIIRSSRIRELISDMGIPLLTYEKFCRDPASVLNILNLPGGVSETINPQASVKVKSYKIQPISDQNERQISGLRDADIASISRVLEPHGELMGFFDYQILRD